jgi:TRAP-type C4-dicarboxylate transport system substrate-binding protein
MNKYLTLTGTLFCLIFGVGLSAPLQADELKWKFGNPWPDKHPASKALVALFADVKARTGGSLDIENVSLRSIGFKQGDLLRVLKDDVVEMSLFVPYYISRDDPLLANTLPSGGLTDAEQNLKIADIQRNYAKKLLKKRWKIEMVSPFFNRGGRDLIIISPSPIHTLDGLKGKKLRHFDKLAMKAMKEMGIPSQSLPQAELYLALKTGVVDAAVHGMTNAARQSIYEVAPNFSEFTPFPGQGAAYGLIVGQASFAKLTQTQKQALEDAGKKSWDEGVVKWRNKELTEEARALMISKGATDLGPFSAAERQKLQQAIFKTWKAESEKLGPEAVTLFNEVSAALQ